MECPFCDWELGLAGGVDPDPCDVVCDFDEHLLEHVNEMTALTG